MNPISPKALLRSKWTKVNPTNRERHFLITTVKIDDQQRVELCEIEAVINGRAETIDWRSLKDSSIWRQGWV